MTVLPAHRTTFALAAFFALAVAALDAVHAQSPAGGAPPGPRYASLKLDRVNLRSGPGTEYPTVWVYRRAGLPVEVMKEFEVWRQVRDAEGTSGWVHQSFVSSRRTALVQPWEVKAGTAAPIVALLAGEGEVNRVVARIEAGVITNVLSCDGKWCLVAIDQFRGYLEQKKLWGVYDAEVIK